MAFDFSAYLELLRNIGGFVLLLGEFLVACLSSLGPAEAIIYHISGAPGSNLLPRALFPPLGKKRGRGECPERLVFFRKLWHPTSTVPYCSAVGISWSGHSGTRELKDFLIRSKNKNVRYKRSCRRSDQTSSMHASYITFSST